MCNFIIYYYIERTCAIKNICLVEFVTKYKKDGTHISKRKKPNVIWFVKCNKYIDYEIFCREKLLLYVPLKKSEYTLKHNWPTWEAAHCSHKTSIQANEAKFTYNVNPTWGDMKSAIQKVDNDLLDVDGALNQWGTNIVDCEYCNLQLDLQYAGGKSSKRTNNLGFQVARHLFLLENSEYYRLRRMLNREQQAIIKDVILKKLRDMQTPLYLFLMGGVGTKKPFTKKIIFQMLILIHDANNTTNPLKPKGLIVTYTGKSGTTIHFSFLMPFNKSQFIPLSREMLDTLSKIYQELELVLIDEVSVVGSQFLFFIDSRLRSIQHVQQSTLET